MTDRQVSGMIVRWLTVWVLAGVAFIALVVIAGRPPMKLWLPMLLAAQAVFLTNGIVAGGLVALWFRRSATRLAEASAAHRAGVGFFAGAALQIVSALTGIWRVNVGGVLVTLIVAALAGTIASQLLLPRSRRPTRDAAWSVRATP